MARPVIEILSNVRCRATRVPAKTLTFLDDALSEVQKGSEFAPTHKRFGGRWDGKKHHFCISPTFDGQGTFPKGLLSRVKRLMAQHSLVPKIIDHREKLPKPDLSCVHADMLHNGLSMSGDYDYQLDVVKKALEQQAGVLALATNAGKTNVASGIISALKNRTVLYVVPSKALLGQTSAELADALGTTPDALGVIGQGKFDPREITIAIINSVTPQKGKSARTKKRNAILREYLKSVDAVFFDEGHHVKAATWFRLVNALVNAQFRYLMSGSPFTGDNDLMIEAGAGPVIARISNDDLIKRGVSAKPTVRLIPCAEPDLDNADDQSWHGINDAGITNNAYRNDLIARTAAAYARAGKSVIVMVRILAHGSNVRTAVAKLKVPVEFVHGQMFDGERDRLKTWFTEKPGRVLVASKIFNEGISMPIINALIIGDAGKSLAKILQQVGRAVRRKKSGANVVDVVDFADSTHNWLAKHALDRIGIYEHEAFEVVEETPESIEKEQSRGDSRDAEADGAGLQALPEQAGVTSELHRTSAHAVRASGSTERSGAEVVQEGSAFLLFFWRQAQGLG